VLVVSGGDGALVDIVGCRSEGSHLIG